MENCSMNQIDITGCRISLYPMKDDFDSHILRSIKETDTTAVWQQTDLFSTLYRGEAASVIDAAAALFVNAYDPKTHLVGEFTFSKGCPGDLAGDAFLSGKHERPNHQQITAKGTFIVQCKYSFYVFGREDYMEEIAHYVTLLSGTAAQLFAYFEQALAYAHEKLPHYVLEGTVSVNSPSLKEASLHE